MSAAATALIVDLGLGNLRSVARAFERHGVSPDVSGDPERVRRADRLVVPGQGAFGSCAALLQGGLGAAITEHVGSGRPYLGICLGMQVLFEGSEEAPGARGLGLLEGTVRRFSRERTLDAGRKLPHMGWNEVEGCHPLQQGKGWFYFVHSYHAVPRDQGVVIGRADYGGSFVAAVAQENLFACQYHPEKSHVEGLELIGRFLSTWT